MGWEWTEGCDSARRKSPLKAIRKKCMECSAGSAREVSLCPVHDCPLWEWRFGCRPETAKKKGKLKLTPRR